MFSAVLGLGVFAAQAPSVDAAEVPVQILGINDFHGALSTTGSYYDGSGNKTSGAGTAALLAGYFNQATKDFETQHQGGVSLRVQAGDMVGASPANSGLLQDEPTMRVLQAMDFSVGTLGNHEFDEGLAEYNRILTGAAPSASDNFYDIVNQYNKDFTQDQLAGKYDVVIANVKNKTDGSNPFGWKDYTVKEYDANGEKVRIGFIGVVTTEIPNLVLAANHQEYTFTDPAEAVAKSAQALVENEKVNAIIVLGHTPSTQTGENTAAGETVDIINKVNQLYPNNHVDAYFAGHNHVYTNAVVGNTRVVQSTSQGKGYIDLQGVYDTTTQDFVATPTATVNPVKPGGIVQPDQTVQAIVDDASNRVKTVTEEKIGQAATAEAITRSVNELGESPVGNLITDAQVYMANQEGAPGADFAITNNGGIRADLAVAADGTITWGAAQAVQPFGNIMQVVKMSGAQLRDALNQQTFSYDATTGQSNGYFLQQSGFTYTVKENPDDATHPYIVDKMMKKDGQAINDNDVYKVVINDFLYGGGDGFTAFTKGELVGAMAPDTETFIGYIEALTANKQQISAKIEGRKTLASTVQTTAIYRTYNPNSGEHFYTTHEGEKNDLVKAGWKFEGISWQSPTAGTAVYRLYNKNAGDHHYTTSEKERDGLVKVGWKAEGTSFYSGGEKQIYRLYNKFAKAGAHHYTLSQEERDSLVNVGWKAEGVGFFGY